MKNILIIAAHPDDEVLGCGGTIARLAIEGNHIFTLILGEGITARDEKRDRIKRGKELKELQKQIKKANKILGTKKIYTFDLPDNQFDTIPLLTVIKKIEIVKNEIKPDVIYTHYPGDLNIDHQITFKAVMTAFRPIKGERVKEIYSFEIPSSTEWNVSLDMPCFAPNYFVDISNTLNLKINALKEYKSEIRSFPHPRSTKAIKVIANRWGIQVGIEAAEAFIIARIINYAPH